MTDQNTAIALEPCPFCGGDEVSYGSSSPGMDGSDSTGEVQCHSCDAILWRRTQTEAIAAWNTRTPAPAPVAVGGDVVALPEYGDWLPDAWAQYMHKLVGSDALNCALRLPATFRWSDFHEHLLTKAAPQAQPTASTAQPVYGDPFDPETDGTDCPSCGGQNISCPDGCGRDPESGELNGTRLETAQPDDVVERVAFAIIEGSAGTRAAEHAKEFQTANWTDACRSARAALAAMQQQAPVADDVRELVEKLRSYYIDGGDGNRSYPAVCEAAAEMLTRLTQPQPDAAVAALRKAEQTFRWYGDLHAAKPDHEKAKRNYDLADEMAAAIRAGGQP